MGQKGPKIMIGGPYPQQKASIYNSIGVNQDIKKINMVKTNKPLAKVNVKKITNNGLMPRGNTLDNRFISN